jgi:hypothetical protein
MKGAAVALPFLLLLASAGVPPARAQENLKEMAFPAEKSTILREGKVAYIVEGRLTIPKGVEVSCQKDVHIRGRGANPTIVVEGSFQVHGVGLREVIFEGVTVELAPVFEDCQIDMAIFRDGGGIVTPKDQAVTGKLFVENTSMMTGCRIDVAFTNGHVDLSSTSSGAETSIRAVDRDDEKQNRVKLKIRACKLTGLFIENVYDVTVILSHLKEGRAEFRDCRTLVFDGNKVNAETLEILSSTPGGLNRTKVLKCDIYSKKVRLSAPLKGDKATDSVTLQNCWFEGEEDPRVVHEDIVDDHQDDEKNGARVKVRNPLERPNELAGAIDR